MKKNGEDKKDLSPAQNSEGEETSIHETWTPKVETVGGFGLFGSPGFSFRLGVNRPPRKPDDEPLQ